MAAPTLRPAVAADMATVADIWHAAWHVAHPGNVPDGLTEARTLASFHERTPARVADTTVVVVDGTVVGFAMTAGDEVEQVFVDPSHHGSGVAGPLLEDAERRVRAAGFGEAWLAVVVGNSRARRFYERHGWVDTGDLPYVVTAGGTTYTSPCRRYVKAL